MEPAKRKLKRVRLVCSLEVYDDRSDDLLGFVVDLSVEGMRVRSPKFLETNTPCRVRLKLPCEIEGRTEIELDAECMWTWSSASDAPGLSDNGFLFHSVTPEAIEIIEVIVGRFRR